MIHTLSSNGLRLTINLIRFIQSKEFTFILRRSRFEERCHTYLELLENSNLPYELKQEFESIIRRRLNNLL
jgi:hypothetical protein